MTESGIDWDRSYGDWRRGEDIRPDVLTSIFIVNVLAEALTVLCQPRVWVVSATRDGERMVIKERRHADAVGWAKYWACSCTDVRLTWRTLRGEVR